MRDQEFEQMRSKVDKLNE